MISGAEFVRRFLIHVPPKRSVRIRHYRILASRNKKKHITLSRNLLDCRAYLPQLKDKAGSEVIKQLWGTVLQPFPTVRTVFSVRDNGFSAMRAFA